MRHTFLLAFAIFIGFISCDTFNDPESPYEEKIVIFGNISGDLPMIDDTIFVSRSASLDEKIDAEALWISDAKVTISGNGSDYEASPVPNRPGRYQTHKSAIFTAGESYTLRVETGGQTLTSKTTIPKSLKIDSNTALKEYTCNDGNTLPIKVIKTDNVDYDGNPIPSRIDTIEYNYGECFTGSFASYPMFALDFEIDESSKLVRTLTMGLDADVLGLEPGTDNDFYDYNWNGKRDSTFICLLYTSPSPRDRG